MNFTQTLTTNPTSPAQRAALMKDPGFGRIFTDHMVTITWTADKGWTDAKIQPRAPFSIDPASAVLHYAQEIFEGLKAYKASNGEITLFRPEENARRLNESAERLAMPSLPEKDFIAAIELLVSTDRDWVPEGDGSLYLRPFMFSDEPFLGVRPAQRYIFCVIASPVGGYFKGGEKPLNVWVSTDYARAARGGTGSAKFGGNYAGSLAAQAQATAHGCDQVLFLDSGERRWIEELGGMNIFFVMKDGSLRTPPLGTILRGITRASVIELANDRRIKVDESPYSFEQLQADVASGALKEVFVCGTAAVIAGVGALHHAGGKIQIGDGQIGPMTKKLQGMIIGIQRGRDNDPHGWVKKVRL